MRPIAIVGWLGIIGALLAWQGLGLVRGPEWPTLSDFFRAFMAALPGRFLLFGRWLWLGASVHPRLVVLLARLSGRG